MSLSPVDVVTVMSMSTPLPSAVLPKNLFAIVHFIDVEACEFVLKGDAKTYGLLVYNGHLWRRHTRRLDAVAVDLGDGYLHARQ